MIVFHSAMAVRHNACMHKLSPMAAAITELARQKVNYRGGRRFIKADGVLNANALSDAMTEAGYALPQPTITRILAGKPVKDPTVKLLAAFFGVKDAVIRGEMDRTEGAQLSKEAKLFAQHFDEMPLSIRQFLTDVRDAWVRLKDGDPFLAEQVLDETKSA